MGNDYLEGWIFTYNAIDKTFAATTRDNHRALFNDYKNPSVLRSRNINTLFSLIIKMKGKIKLEYLNTL